MYHNYSYERVLAACQRVAWRVEDIIGGDKRLDFTKPFMPESLAKVSGLHVLTPREQLALNHVRGHAYLALFGLVEEFILPFVLDHARPRLHGDDHRVRALLAFASEEAKHIHLFKRFREEFEAGFGSRCEVIGPPDAIARSVLAHEPLAVALAILHIEWMTQRHYLDSVKDHQELDPQFKNLLRYHWIEEARHAKLDTLMVEALADGAGERDIERGVEGYLEIVSFLDAGLGQQAIFDLKSVERATGRQVSRRECELLIAAQHQANRWTFIGSGMTHASFLGTVGQLGEGWRARIEKIAPAYC